MSQQPSILQTILQNLPDIIQSLPVLKSLFERRKRKRKGQAANEKMLSVQDLNEIDIYVVGNVKTYRKKFKVVESPRDEVNTRANIPSNQRADITLTTEDGNTKSLQTPTAQSVDVPREILEQLTPGTVFWLESNVYIELSDLLVMSSSPSPLLPTTHAPRESTTLTLTNISRFPIRDFERPLPLEQLYPIYGFELEKGGRRISDQLIKIHLRWAETLTNEELQELEGYAHNDSILSYFSEKRKQRPKYALSIQVDELKPKEAVTLVILHNPPPKQPLGFPTSHTQ